MSMFNEIENLLQKKASNNLWEGIEHSKVKQVMKLVHDGEYEKALKLAGTFRYKKTNLLGQKITQGKEALLNPSFYKQLKKDPQKLVEEGIEAVKEMYALENN